MATDHPIDGKRFREALGLFPTGVTVVTAHGTGGPIGMAANSFGSLSLRPPMVFVCPAKTSETWPEIRTTGQFCISILAADHTEIARQFSCKGIERFAGIDYVSRESGPALEDALAWLDCELYVEHEAGDHTIAIGKVLRIEVAQQARPLVFYRGAFGTVVVTDEQD